MEGEGSAEQQEDGEPERRGWRPLMRGAAQLKGARVLMWRVLKYWEIYYQESAVRCDDFEENFF